MHKFPSKRLGLSKKVFDYFSVLLPDTKNYQMSANQVILSQKNDT